MIRMLLRLRLDESGQSLALIAIMIAGLMGMVALVVDLGSLFMAHREAQRAADAAALAGANEFILKSPAAAAVPHAYDSAMAYATRNYIQNVFITAPEVTVQVLPAEQKVWVRIERQGLGLWFARVLGHTFGTVSAAAAAAAMPAGAADCVAPFAVPDLWYEVNQDADGDGVFDAGEAWNFKDDPLGLEYYERFNNDPAAFPAETGYGSAMRNNNGAGITNDYGLPIVLKVQDPQHSPTSGFFYPFQPDNKAGGGANAYEASIIGCDDSVVPLNAPVLLEMGDMVGKTINGINTLVAQDPGAQWDQFLGRVTGSVMSNWLKSPRIKIVPLYDPAQIALIHSHAQNKSPGTPNVVSFNNFALIFVDSTHSVPAQNGPDDVFIMGRFLYFAQGLGNPGGATGSLARVLQLVE